MEFKLRLGFTERYVAVPYTRASVAGTDRTRATVAMMHEQLRTLSRPLL